MTEEWVRGTRPSGRPREEAVAPQRELPVSATSHLQPAFFLECLHSQVRNRQALGFVIGCFLQRSPQRCLSSARGSLLVHPLNH